jgi:heme-degrading monooxygenase HmoA
MSFVYVWEYRVRPGSVAAFEAAYGAEGAWVRLFRSHAGYLGTELLRDASDPTRYQTIDRWRSRADRDRCREAAAAELEAIDRACEALTVEERHLGDFEIVGEGETG